MRVQILKTKVILADPCHVADSFVTRLIGLMGRAQLGEGEALWFPRCSSVHTWFMRMPLDIVFLRRLVAESHRYEVTSIVAHAKAWSILPFGDRRSTDVLELSSGVCARAQLREGDVVCTD